MKSLSSVGGLGAEIFNFDELEFFKTLSESLQTLKLNNSTPRLPTEECQTILEMAAQWQSNKTAPTALLALPAVSYTHLTLPTNREV